MEQHTDFDSKGEDAKLTDNCDQLVSTSAPSVDTVSNLKDSSGNGEQASAECPEFSEDHNYELVDGKYYYTDAETSCRYYFDSEINDWVESDTQTTDEEGRTYYYAAKKYWCRNPDESVFYMEQGVWQPWQQEAVSEAATDESTKNVERPASVDLKWHFYKGDKVFYRDNVTNIVYKLNKETNEWEEHKEKRKWKRDQDEEFEEEFDSEEEDEEEECGGTAPPGCRNDPSINYDGYTYTKRDMQDNMMYEWDPDRSAWFPKLDDDFMATYQLSYGFNPDGTKNENPLKFDDEKEFEDEKLEEEAEKKKKEKNNAKEKKNPTWFEMDDAHNTKVYVTNLPTNLSEEDFVDLMQKCGLVLKDPESNRYRIKMYRSEDGEFKGDALCTYIKVESVHLALQILDGYQVGDKKISVEKAKFTLKGDYNPALKPRKKRKKDLEKMQKKQEKLFAWHPEPVRGQRGKHETTVVIRNVFDPMEFATAVERILEHKEAMRGQCVNFGDIKKLELYDLNQNGVVQVTFRDVESADLCVSSLNDRMYLGRKLVVSTWDGKETFKIEETDEQREERLKKWDKFLDMEDHKKIDEDKTPTEKDNNILEEEIVEEKEDCEK